MYHYCSVCGNVMIEFNNYGYRTLNCKGCGQEVIYGHKDKRKDQEDYRGPEEAIQEAKE